MPSKAVTRKRVPVPHVFERERAMWGPHPDRWIAAVEQDYYRPGFQFLSDLYGAALGQNPPRELRKAFGLPDWGTIAGLFKRKDLSPMQQRDGWAQVIDRLVSGLFNQRTKEEMAAAVAVKAHWLGRVRALSEGQGQPGAGSPVTWHDAAGRMRPAEVQAMEWTRARALEHARALDDTARHGLMNVLLQARQEGLGTRDLARRCYDRFADLNRDWRRLALTETASAVENGKLAAVDPAAEEWEAVWVSCARGCAHCQAWNGRVFKVVPPDSARKDGSTMIWQGKSNVGRSAAPTKRDGTKRGPGELWWPCIPCHPNCGCQFVLRRVRR